MIKIKTGSFSLKGSKLSVPRFESLSNNEIVTEEDFENASQIDDQSEDSKSKLNFQFLQSEIQSSAKH